MSSGYLDQGRSLEELYALMDRDRVAAARLAQSVFAADVDAALAGIVEISSVASARVMADTQVASAKLLIDAEVAATRLSVGAELAISEYRRHVLDSDSADSPEVVEAMIAEIGRVHSEHLSDSARQSIEAIQRDADAAIARLQEVGVAAIADIRDLATTLSLRTQAEAAKACERLKTYRQHPHTQEEVVAAEDEAVQLLADAAEVSAHALRDGAAAALRNIHGITDEACANIRSAAIAAQTRIEATREKALARLRQVVEFHKIPD